MTRPSARARRAVEPSLRDSLNLWRTLLPRLRAFAIKDIEREAEIRGSAIFSANPSARRYQASALLAAVALLKAAARKPARVAKRARKT